MHPINYEIRENIRKFCARKNITVSTCAENAGISKGTMSKLMNDLDFNPKLHTLEKIAFVLEVELIELFL